MLKFCHRILPFFRRNFFPSWLEGNQSLRLSGGSGGVHSTLYHKDCSVFAQKMPTKMPTNSLSAEKVLQKNISLINLPQWQIAWGWHTMRHIIIGSIIATLPTIVMAAPAGSFNECLDHFPNKTPPQVQETTKQGMLRALCYEAFAILHSGTTKTPVYVVELSKLPVRQFGTAGRVGKRTAISKLPVR